MCCTCQCKVKKVRASKTSKEDRVLEYLSHLEEVRRRERSNDEHRQWMQRRKEYFSSWKGFFGIGDGEFE